MIRKPGNRRGVGRRCEYEARTPGKTGEYGKTYPGNYAGWTRFSIEVFQGLLAHGKAFLVNEVPQDSLTPLDEGTYYLLECFPTSTWHTSGLIPLPGHRRATRAVIQQWAGGFTISLWAAGRWPDVQS